MLYALLVIHTLLNGSIDLCVYGFILLLRLASTDPTDCSAGAVGANFLIHISATFFITSLRVTSLFIFAFLVAARLTYTHDSHIPPPLSLAVSSSHSPHISFASTECCKRMRRSILGRRKKKKFTLKGFC